MGSDPAQRRSILIAGACSRGLTPASQVFLGVQHILARRRATPALHAAHPLRVVDCAVPGLFAFVHAAPTGPLLCVFNFTEHWTSLPATFAHSQGITQMHDALSDQPVQTYDGRIPLPPYARVWLR